MLSGWIWPGLDHVQVASGAECRVLAGDDDGPQGRVGGQVHDVGLELHHQAGAERVEAFRVAQGEDGPGLVAFDVHEAALVAGTLAEQFGVESHPGSFPSGRARKSSTAAVSCWNISSDATLPSRSPIRSTTGTSR
jgi:hypothetical protein